MSVAFEDFLTSAETLLNKDSEEIDFRNLISRSYYALFHLAKEKSHCFPVPVSDEEYKKLGSHEKIFIKFSRHPNRAIKQQGEMMFKAKDLRRKADYYIDEHIVRTETVEHLFAIRGLIQKLQQLKETP